MPPSGTYCGDFQYPSEYQTEVFVSWHLLYFLKHGLGNLLHGKNWKIMALSSRLFSILQICFPPSGFLRTKVFRHAINFPAEKNGLPSVACENHPLRRGNCAVLDFGTETNWS